MLLLSGGTRIADKEHFSLKVLDGCAAPSEDTKRFKDKLDTHYEDAGFKEDTDKGETIFVFAEGLVVFKERTVAASDPEALLEKVTSMEDIDASKVVEGYLGEPPKEMT